MDRNDDGSIMIIQVTNQYQFEYLLFSCWEWFDIFWRTGRARKVSPTASWVNPHQKSCRECLMDVWCSSKSCGGVVGWNTHVSSYVIIDNIYIEVLICYVLAFRNAFSASCGHCTRNNLTIAREHHRDAGLLRYSESWMISLWYVVLWILRATESKLAPLSEYKPFGMYWWS